MATDSLCTIESEIGMLRITGSNGGIKSITFVAEEEHSEALNPNVDVCATQLREYFAGQLRQFHTFPLDIEGTDFQMLVWEEVRKVLYGTTATYGEIAQRIGDENAARAVGSVVTINPCAIVIPCHRIVPQSGGAGGYLWGKNRKEWLLRHEGHSF